MNCYADQRPNNSQPSESVEPPVPVAYRHLKPGQIGQPSIVSSVAFAAFNSVLFGSHHMRRGKNISLFPRSRTLQKKEGLMSAAP